MNILSIREFYSYLQAVLLCRTVAYVQRTGYEIVLHVDDEKYVDGSNDLRTNEYKRF